jgi:hypothetical protein
MVHNSKALITAFKDQVLPHVSTEAGAFVISGPSKEGELFLRVKSTETESSDELAFRFIAAMNSFGRMFTQTDDNKFRFPLNQFQ